MSFRCITIDGNSNINRSKRVSTTLKKRRSENVSRSSKDDISPKSNSDKSEWSDVGGLKPRSNAEPPDRNGRNPHDKRVPSVFERLSANQSRKDVESRSPSSANTNIVLRHKRSSTDNTSSRMRRSRQLIDEGKSVPILKSKRNDESEKVDGMFSSCDNLDEARVNDESDLSQRLIGKDDLMSVSKDSRIDLGSTREDGYAQIEENSSLVCGEILKFNPRISLADSGFSSNDNIDDLNNDEVCQSFIPNEYAQFVHSRHNILDSQSGSLATNTSNDRVARNNRNVLDDAPLAQHSEQYRNIGETTDVCLDSSTPNRLSSSAGADCIEESGDNGFIDSDKDVSGANRIECLTDNDLADKIANEFDYATTGYSNDDRFKNHRDTRGADVIESYDDRECIAVSEPLCDSRKRISNYEKDLDADNPLESERKIHDFDLSDSSVKILENDLVLCSSSSNYNGSESASLDRNTSTNYTSPLSNENDFFVQKEAQIIDSCEVIRDTEDVVRDTNDRHCDDDPQEEEEEEEQQRCENDECVQISSREVTHNECNNESLSEQSDIRTERDESFSDRRSFGMRSRLGELVTRGRSMFSDVHLSSYIPDVRTSFNKLRSLKSTGVAQDGCYVESNPAFAINTDSGFSSWNSGSDKLPSSRTAVNRLSSFDMSPSSSRQPNFLPNIDYGQSGKKEQSTAANAAVVDIDSESSEIFDGSQYFPSCHCLIESEVDKAEIDGASGCDGGDGYDEVYHRDNVCNCPVESQLSEDIQEILEADRARMWWTITGNFGNILPIDWTKTYTRQKFLPALNLNETKKTSTLDIVSPSSQSTSLTSSPMTSMTMSCCTIEDSHREEEEMKGDLDLHQLILGHGTTPDQEPVMSAEEVIREIDDIMRETISSEDDVTDPGSSVSQRGLKSSADDLRSIPPRLSRSKLDEMSSNDLSDVLMEYESVIRQYSETLISQLALRDELEYEKELKNSFISLLLQVQNKRRNLNHERKKPKKPLGYTDSKYLTTVIPYDVGHGPPNIHTIQILIKILMAINEDNPTVPTLLTDYILKVLCPS